jgi:hypothetical protein
VVVCCAVEHACSQHQLAARRVERKSIFEALLPGAALVSHEALALFQQPTKPGVVALAQIVRLQHAQRRLARHA